MNVIWKIDLMIFEADKVILFILELLKQSRARHHLKPMVLLRYPDQEICVVSHLEQYTSSIDIEVIRTVFFYFIFFYKKILSI